MFETVQGGDCGGCFKPKYEHSKRHVRPLRITKNVNSNRSNIFSPMILMHLAVSNLEPINQILTLSVYTWQRQNIYTH